MYFNQQMFNPSTVNPSNYHAVKNQIARLDMEQNKEIANAVKAVHDLCEAVKKLDEAHQHTAFLLFMIMFWKSTTRLFLILICLFRSAWTISNL